jgi:hypothetical protein
MPGVPAVVRVPVVAAGPVGTVAMVPAGAPQHLTRRFEVFRHAHDVSLMPGVAVGDNDVRARSLWQSRGTSFFGQWRVRANESVAGMPTPRQTLLLKCPFGVTFNSTGGVCSEGVCYSASRSTSGHWRLRVSLAGEGTDAVVDLKNVVAFDGTLTDDPGTVAAWVERVQLRRQVALEGGRVKAEVKAEAGPNRAQVPPVAATVARPSVAVTTPVRTSPAASKRAREDSDSDAPPSPLQASLDGVQADTRKILKTVAGVGAQLTLLQQLREGPITVAGVRTVAVAGPTWKDFQALETERQAAVEGEAVLRAQRDRAVTQLRAARCVWPNSGSSTPWPFDTEPERPTRRR